MRKILVVSLLLVFSVVAIVSAEKIHSKWVNSNNLVYYTEGNQHRWYDAMGEDVVKWCEDYTLVPIGADNADPAGYTLTAIAGDAGDGTFTGGTTYGGELTITTDDTENDGINVQLAGEAFLLADGDPCYFGIRLDPSDADQCDLIVGLATTDTGIWASWPHDIICFQSADETGVCTFKTSKDSTVTTDTSAGTLTDAYHILEFYWDGSTYIHAYFDGTLVASSSTNLPDNEALTPTIELLTGEGNVNNVIVDWWKVIQVR